MVKIPANLPLLSAFLLVISGSSHSVSAFGNNQSKPELKMHIGYVGFNGVPRAPRASAVGDLGAVFYAADVRTRPCTSCDLTVPR